MLRGDGEKHQGYPPLGMGLSAETRCCNAGSDADGFDMFLHTQFVDGYDKSLKGLTRMPPVIFCPIYSPF